METGSELEKRANHVRRRMLDNLTRKSACIDDGLEMIRASKRSKREVFDDYKKEFGLDGEVSELKNLPNGVFYILGELKIQGHEATYYHHLRCGYLALIIGKECGIEDSSFLEAALMHDCGKINLFPETLNKEKEQMESWEWDLLRMHPADGARIAESNGLSAYAIYLIENHHVPPKDKTKNGPLVLLSLLEWFDAMLEDGRKYRDGPLKIEHTVADLKKEFSGKEKEIDFLKNFYKSPLGKRFYPTHQLAS